MKKSNLKLMTLVLCLFFSALIVPKNTLALSTPSAPTNLEATVMSFSRIDLEWDSVSDATSYLVYRATSSSGTFKIIATTTTTKYKNTSLPEDTTYYYKVKAKNKSGTSAYSSIAYETTEESDTLSAPTGLRAEAESSSRIDLKWDSVSDATSYLVYRATSSSGTFEKIATTKTTSYRNFDLADDTTYYYKVKAVNSSEKSDFSSTVRDTTEESDTLSAPKDLSAKVESSGKIYLNWDSVSGATSYYIYRATSSSGIYSRIASTTTTSSYTNTGLSNDTTYYYKVKAVNNSRTSPYSSIAHATTKWSSNASSPIQSARLAGQDLYGTSAEVARSGWTNSDFAIIASGEDFADALCGAPLAKKYNAPILLTAKNSLNEQSKNQLSRLKVKHVFIIGGLGIISSKVERDILNMGIQVSRIAGNDRYETSLKVAQTMGQFTQAVIATGENFPDALSIAPIAAMKGIPILLTPKNNLPEGLKEYLNNNVQSTYIVGGTGVISNNVFNQLPSPKRLSGTTGYDTNISIIKEFINELDFKNCYIATGENFPDALAGSVLASLTKSPVILVSNSAHQSTDVFVKSKSNSIDKITAFGGMIVVPESILSGYYRT